MMGAAPGKAAAGAFDHCQSANLERRERIPVAAVQAPRLRRRLDGDGRREHRRVDV